MANKRLTRSSDRMIAGVCGGIAEYFGWDPTMLRVLYTLATIFTAFSGIIVSYRKKDSATAMKTE